MSRVVMLLANAFRPDPRVAREAAALLEAGWRVTIICWDRCRELPPREDHQGVEIVRVHDVPSGYARGWRQLGSVPAFWRRATALALARDPAVVHCHDLDTLYAGWRVKRRSGCRLVYDAHEPYPALMSLYLPPLLVRLLELWERWLQRHVDATITASTLLREVMLQRGVDNVTALGNYQELGRHDAVTEEAAASLRQQLGIADDELLVAYIGVFSRNRALLALIEAASKIEKVQLRLWGDGPQRPAVETALAGVPNARYMGWLDERELPVHYRAADVVYYGLRHDYPGAVFTASNSVANAMAAGRPVIASDLGDVGRMVSDGGCGLLLQDISTDTVAEAISRLRDASLRDRLGRAGRRAAEQTYNAAAVQARLVELYRRYLPVQTPVESGR